MNTITASQRFGSLDVFRGLTIMLMLLVNNPGTYKHIYAPFRHAIWHGWTLTDLVFPFFVFIVGMAIPLSLNKYLLQSKGFWKITLRILRRTLLIFLFGLILSGFPFKWENLRIPGVLQRIALCYFMGSMIYLVFARQQAERIKVSVSGLLITFFSLLLGYFLMMKFVSVPGYGVGLLDSKEGNMAAYIDRLLLPGHLWSYAKGRWDPEGLFSTIPAIASTIGGMLCTWLIIQEKTIKSKLITLGIGGLVMVVLGYSLSPFFPINKALWSSSYVLLTTGLAFWSYGLIYWLIDIKQIKLLQYPWVVLGTNAILIYFLSSWVAIRLVKIKVEPGLSLKNWLYQHLFQSMFPWDNFSSLAFALTYTSIWLGLATILYKRKLFIRL